MRSSSRWLLVLPAVALGVATGCCRPGGTGPAAGGPPTVADKPAVLADMKDLQPSPPDAVVGYVNEWGTGGALVIQGTSGARVAFRERISPEHEYVAGVAFSPDGKRIAYAVRAEGGMQLVLDGKAGERFELVGEPIFSRDGRHLVYRAQVGGRYHLVIDDRKGPAVAGIEGEPFQLAGRDEVVVVERATEGGPQEVVAYSYSLQRRALASLEEATEFLPGQDGGRLVAVVGAEGARRVVDLTFGGTVGRAEGETFDEITALSLDRRSGSLMYVGIVGHQGYLVRDGSKAPIPSIDVVERPVLEPASKSVAFAYIADGSVHLGTAFGGASASPAYAGVNELVRSPDGRRLAFAAVRRSEAGEESFVVVDGVEASERWDRVVSPRFSPDGRFLVYRARKEGQRMMVIADATGRMVRRLPAFEQVFTPAFTADGKALGYAVKDGSKLRWLVEPL
jgi:hypothetical protein